MNELQLEWVEAAQRKTKMIQEQPLSQNSGMVRLGRDPSRCDIILTHPTVSGLHAEIYFDARHPAFKIRNLRSTNPPIVDSQPLPEQETAILKRGSQIFLGQVELTVVAISLQISHGVNTVLIMPPEIPQPLPLNMTGPSASASPVQYGLQCPKCQRISAYQQLVFGCPWCGTSLAAAMSVLMPPH